MTTETTVEALPMVFTVHNSEEWHRAKTRAKPGDWIVIPNGVNSTAKAGICWIRCDTQTPTFAPPIPVERLSSQQRWTRAR